MRMLRRHNLFLLLPLLVVVCLSGGTSQSALAYDCPPGCPTYVQYETHWDDCGHCDQPFEKTWWHDRHRTCCACNGCDYWILDATGCGWCQ